MNIFLSQSTYIGVQKFYCDILIKWCIITFRLNYSFGPYFRSKISIWSLNFFISIWSLFWEIWCNQVLSVIGVVTVLNGVSCVSFWIFWIFYFLFLKFFLIKLKFCHVSSWHRATWQWSCHMAVIVSCVTIMPGVIFLFSIWSQYFNFYLNLFPFFVKMV